MSARDDGGSAFPTIESNGDGHVYCSGAGMTLRDYFAARAPAEPQLWFQPTMPGPRPDYPDFRALSKDDQDFWRHGGGIHEIASPAMVAYAAARNETEKLQRAFDVEREKQRLIQWPYAWADEQIKARAA